MSSSKLYVGNLPAGTSDSALKKLLSTGGRCVRNVSMSAELANAPARCFAFVEMASEREASAVTREFNGFVLQGRTLAVCQVGRPQEGRPSPARPPGS